MYLLIAGAVIVMVLVARGLIKDGLMSGGCSERAAGIFVVVLMGLVGAIVALLLSLIICAFAPVEAKLDGYSEVVALRDNTTVSGNFFLGIGSVNGALMYNYFIKVDEGKYRAQSVYACGGGNRDVIIVEEENPDPPRIEHYNCYFKGDIWEKLVPFGPMGCEGRRYEIHIPKGSIVRGYQLDLQ